MCRIRAAKIQRIVADVPDAQVHGDADAKILMLGWGSPYGSITAACEEARRRGIKVAQVHLRHLNPFPANLGAILKKFPRVIVPELNLGQLLMVIRAKFLVDARGLNKVQGKPFKVSELVEAIEQEAKTLQGNGSAK
jgi:2-oxoglutarate ferredoxin oxidoreductase subunit alpha